MQDDELDELQWVSALADGQVQADAMARVVASVGRSDRARAAWHSYHVIGEALRGNDLVDCPDDQIFLSRMRARLERLGPPSADVEFRPSLATAPTTVAAAGLARSSANDAASRWKWLAAAATVAAVTLVGWNLLPVGAAPGAAVQLAESGNSVGSVNPVSGPGAPVEPQVMLRDPRLDELLAAHRQYGGASALQTAAGFLRNATFEQPAR